MILCSLEQAVRASTPSCLAAVLPGACRSTATSSRPRTPPSGAAAPSSTCPPGLRGRGALRDRLRDRAPRRRAVRAHARDRRPRHRDRAARVRPRRGLRRSRASARRCTRARSSCTWRTAPAAAWRSCTTGARARSTTPRRAVVEVGRDAYCHWLPALLGGHLVRHHDELAVAGAGGDMAFRGLLFSRGARAPRRLRGRPPRDRPLGRRRALARRRDRREPGELRGADPDQPGRAADPHLPAVPLDDALRRTASSTRSPRCSCRADDVSASHGGTVGELDETAIFYMQSRGLDRPAAVRVIVEGFFEPLIAELARRAARGARSASGSAPSSPPRATDIERYALAR